MKKFWAFLIFFACLMQAFSVDMLHDDVLDLDYRTESYCKLSGEFLKVELYGKTGTFNIYCTPKGSLDVPLFSTVDLFDTTGFLLKVNEEVFRLNKSKRVKKELRHLDNGAQLVYTTENGIQLIVDFSLVASKKNSYEDIVKIRLYTINRSEKASGYSVDLKGIFDTCCGEVSSVHFVTEDGTKIRNENRFLPREIKRERAVLSGDGRISFQFVLDGNGVSELDSVLFANIDELYKMKWDSGYRKGRGFTNSRSYDNSGIMLDWPESFLFPNEKTEYTFYIAVAEDKYPRGLLFVDGIGLGTEENAENQTQDEAAPAEPKPNSEKRTDVEFIIPPIKDYQLDSGYIQDLIDRIDALQSAKKVDKKQLKRLNAELDAILEKMRRQ